MQRDHQRREYQAIHNRETKRFLIIEVGERKVNITAFVDTKLERAMIHMKIWLWWRRKQEVEIHDTVRVL